MSEPGVRCVCDPTLMMRARLLCGLYSKRTVPPRWQRLALAYCLTVAAACCFFIYGLFSVKMTRVLYTMILAWQHLFAILVSLWTGDQYIYSYCTQNELTDVTLDSRMIFGRFQKQIKKVYIIALFYVTVFFGISVIAWHEYDFKIFIRLVLPSLLLDLCQMPMTTAKLLVMGLFNARMLVLKRRLQRYGFRTAGRAPPQPYCQVYDAILQGLGATDYPLKVMLFFDLIFSCSKIISNVTYAVYNIQWQTYEESANLFNLLCYILSVTKILVFFFGHVALLESAAAHCEDMAVFTATQLIKTPTRAERRHMRLFLRALERRGARYRLLHALPLDARLALRALDFCSAQVIVFVNTIKDA